ncbi:hypothetical protein, partial [Thiocystis violacea]|uniref:hypothetical protein n=1 Tax=Thiocystis violacea TaxID=13725 RepID=UPI001A92BFD6
MKKPHSEKRKWGLRRVQASLPVGLGSQGAARNQFEPDPNGTKISLSIFKNKQLQPLMRFAESVSSALFLRVAMVTDLFLC